MRELRRDDRVAAAGLVGSLGRGDADDWSDVDLLFVVDDPHLADFERPSELPQSAAAVLTFDARHNAPRGVHATSGQYLADTLPLWVDWYVYPASRGVWVNDSQVDFDTIGLPHSAESFDQHLARREPQEPTAGAADDHELLQLALVPMAGKRIARRSPDTDRMIEFLGGSLTKPGVESQIEALRRLLDTYRGRGPTDAIEAGHRYLDLVAARTSRAEPSLLSLRHVTLPTDP